MGNFLTAVLSGLTVMAITTLAKNAVKWWKAATFQIRTAVMFFFCLTSFTFQLAYAFLSDGTTAAKIFLFACAALSLFNTSAVFVITLDALNKILRCVPHDKGDEEPKETG